MARNGAAVNIADWFGHHRQLNFFMPPELVQSEDIKAARELALAFHGDQKYGGLPYATHLNDVVEVLKRFGKDSEALVCAAWLHDVIEDAPNTRATLWAIFSSTVCGLVEAVTNEPGANRKERHLATWPKLRHAGADAVTLKVADRIANTEFSFRHGAMSGMYRKEFPAFKEALYREGECDVMWEHLESISARPEAA